MTEKSLNTYSRIYPRLKDIRELSIKIAVEIAEHCYRNGTATLYPEPEDKVAKAFVVFLKSCSQEQFIRYQVHSVDYEELINRSYDWPAKDKQHGFPIPVMKRHSMDDE